MVRTIILHEIREIIGSQKFGILLSVASILVLLTFITGALEHKADLRYYQAALSQNADQFSEAETWKQVWGTRVFLKPDPLASLVTGIANDIDRVTLVQPGGSLNTEQSKYGQVPVMAAFRLLDLEFIFGTVLSLFAILLCFDAVCGEKERGTLRLVFSNAVPRVHYLFGKVAGISLATLLPLLVVFACGALALPAVGVEMSGGDWARLALVLGVGFLYVLCCVCMALLFSVLTRHASHALLILLVLWLAFTQLLPRIAVLSGGYAIDVPNNMEMAVARIRLFADKQHEQFERLSAFQPSPNATPDQALAEFNRLEDSIKSVRDSVTSAFAARQEQERENRQGLRAAYALSFARVSPNASLVLAMTRIAGSDLGLQQRQRSYTRTYQQILTRFLTEKSRATTEEPTFSSDADQGGANQKKEVDFREVPEFVSPSVSSWEALQSIVPDIGLLLLWLCGALIGAGIAFNRYDLR